MSAPYARAPHVGDRHFDPAPQAALLIDFDNVTLGRGSDLTKELRTLLDSEIITSKVAVQRAYADWRRYPQYIVPLSEASIDLIFAPAYGSSKKNATDIRMAIDAIELVFVRPEIGTFILLTGDSDFSSVVLKLKEYGKYVIGVGIQESSSDILVQNCDEYYSYTALTGLTKTSEATRVQFDPWVLVEEAVNKMTERRDVMRSDRLKQVMREIDKGFNETEHGFPKFSKFLAEASSRGLVKLRKMENGQYEVAAGKKKKGGRGRRAEPAKERARPVVPPPSTGDPIQDAYALLRSAMGELATGGRDSARDSDVKRRILVLEPNFDEAELGFPKFSMFLRRAEEHQVVTLSRKEPDGYTEVRLTESGGVEGVAPEPAPASAGEEPRSAPAKAPPVTRGRRTRPRRGAGESASPPSQADPPAIPTSDSDTQEDPAAEQGQASEERPERRQEKDRGDRTKGQSRGRGGRRGRGASDATPPEAEVVESTETAAPPKASPENGKSWAPAEATPPEPDARPVPAPSGGSASRTLHSRQTSRRRGPDGPPPIFEGQGIVVGGGAAKAAAVQRSTPPTETHSPGAAATEMESKSSSTGSALQGLPTEPGAIQRYLTHRYKGVGEKTAEQVVEAFGSQVFDVLDAEPERVSQILSEHRAEALLAAWQADKARRLEGNGGSAS